MAGRPTSLAHDISLAIRTATHPPPSLARRRARVRRVRGPIGPDATAGARPGAPDRAAARAAGRHPADSAGDLPGRDRVRRGRRGRHRRARQPREGPHPRGFRRLRRRQAAEGGVLLAGRDPGRAPGSLRQRVAADRAGRPLERPAVRRPHLRAAPRQQPHRPRCAARWSRRRRTSSSTSTWAPTTSPPSSTPRAAPPPRRSSPTIRGCCTPRSTASSARSCARARWSASTSTTATRCCSRRRATARPAATSRSSTRSTANGASTPARRSARCAAWPTSWDRSAAGARRS